jgi:hypothetical protein
MLDESDRERLRRGGFSPDEIDALLEVFSIQGHSHAIEDVIGLDEELEELEEG